MRILLEILRVILIFIFLGAWGWAILANIYTTHEVTESYSWPGAIGILVLLFILYRNKLQFSGWYIGEGRVKLPKLVSTFLILSSILLFMIPFMLEAFLR